MPGLLDMLFDGQSLVGRVFDKARDGARGAIIGHVADNVVRPVVDNFLGRFRGR